MSEVLALAVEALVPLRHKAVNGCLIKFPGLSLEPVLHLLLDIIVRGDSFASQSLIYATNNGVITGREVWTVWRMTEILPIEFLQECHDCAGCLRPCFVMEQNGPTGELLSEALFVTHAIDVLHLRHSQFKDKILKITHHSG